MQERVRINLLEFLLFVSLVVSVAHENYRIGSLEQSNIRLDRETISWPHPNLSTKQ